MIILIQYLVSKIQLLLSVHSKLHQVIANFTLCLYAFAPLSLTLDSP